MFRSVPVRKEGMNNAWPSPFRCLAAVNTLDRTRELLRIAFPFVIAVIGTHNLSCLLPRFLPSLHLLNSTNRDRPDEGLFLFVWCSRRVVSVDICTACTSMTFIRSPTCRERFKMSFFIVSSLFSSSAIRFSLSSARCGADEAVVCVCRLQWAELLVKRFHQGLFHISEQFLLLGKECLDIELLIVVTFRLRRPQLVCSRNYFTSHSYGVSFVSVIDSYTYRSPCISEWKGVFLISFRQENDRKF